MRNRPAGFQDDRGNFAATPVGVGAGSEPGRFEGRVNRCVRRWVVTLPTTVSAAPHGAADTVVDSPTFFSVLSAQACQDSLGRVLA